MTEVLDLLVAGRNKLVDRNAWCQGYKTKVDGLEGVVQHCAIGAMWSDDADLSSKAWQVLNEVADYYYGVSVVRLNDTENGHLRALVNMPDWRKRLTHVADFIGSDDPWQHVLFVYDQAIAGTLQVLAESASEPSADLVLCGV